MFIWHHQVAPETVRGAQSCPVPDVGGALCRLVIFISMVPKTNKSVFWIWILNWTLPSPYQYISSMVPHPHWHLKVFKAFLLFIYFEQCIFPRCDVVYVNLLLSYFHNMALDKFIVFISDMTDIFVRSFAVSNTRLLWTSKHTKLQN